MIFKLDLNSELPTSTHVLIGNNGTGKTTILKDIFKRLNEEAPVQSNFSEEFIVNYSLKDIESEEELNKQKTLFISYSPFDIDELKSNDDNYIGLSHKENFEDQLSDYYELISKDQSAVLIEYLELFGFLEPESFIQQVSDKNITQRLSSGQKIVLLGLFALLAKVEEKTIILFDEPKLFLHPPLLSTYIRIITDIMNKNNGLAIIATHSPIILQEVPTECVHHIDKAEDNELCFSVHNPKINTFGENLSTLTDDIFGFDIKNTGFYKIIDKIVEQQVSSNDTKPDERLLRKLGMEAKFYYRVKLKGD